MPGASGCPLSLSASSGGCCSARPSTRSMSAARQAARAQQHRLSKHADNGGFDADRDRAAIDDQVDPARRGRFAHGRQWSATRAPTDWPTAPPPGRRRRAGCRARSRCAGYPDRDGVEAGGGEIGHRAVGRLGQHQRQRARPEGFGQQQCARVKTADPPRRIEVADMGDQRIEGRPALGLVKPGDRGRVGGVGAEAINRLGRERDQPAPGKDARRRGHGSLAGGQNRCFQAHIHRELFLNSASCGSRNPRL